MSEPSMVLEVKQATAWITVNRPQIMNALDLPTLAELGAAFDRAQADSQVRVIVFTGAGRKAFIAGGDIADLESRGGLPHYLEFAEKIHELFARIERSDKVTIAAVNGWALGGGLELLLCTDLRIAAQSARIGVPEINLGLFPGAGGSQRLSRQIPLCKAKEMMFLGNSIDAAQAERLGIVNRVVADDALRAEVAAIAEALASKSPLVLKLLKRTVADGLEMPIGQALRHEQAMIGLVFDTADAHEGCKAFLEKRPARFTGA
jgi:enoyl-CoA hydratase